MIINISKIKNISAIINLAATNLRESEENHTKSINININGTINLLNIAIQLDIPYILLSTGAVFSSKISDNIFNEKFIKSPNCFYGVTKSTSEDITLLYT